MKGGEADGEDSESQKALLHSRIGAPGSGAARYAAAMYFHTQGMMPLDMLEIYRRCSRFDSEDPIDMARHEGVEIPPLSRASAPGGGE